MTVSVDGFDTSPERTAQLAAPSARSNTDGSIEPRAARVQAAGLSSAPAAAAAFGAVAAIARIGEVASETGLAPRAVAATTASVAATPNVRRMDTRLHGGPKRSFISSLTDVGGARR